MTLGCRSLRMQLHVSMVALCHRGMPLQVPQRIATLVSRWRWVADGGAVMGECNCKFPWWRCVIGNSIAGFHDGSVLLGNAILQIARRLVTVGSRSLWVADGAAVLLGKLLDAL